MWAFPFFQGLYSVDIECALCVILQEWPKLAQQLQQHLETVVRRICFKMFQAFPQAKALTFGSSFSVGREKIGFNGFKTTSMICADDPPSGSFFGLF